MKKAIIGIVVVALVAGGGYYAWTRRAGAEADKAPEVTAKVERGPIRMIVAATGRVVSNLDVDIKCKASGAVVKLPFDVSDTAKKGDLLVELDPVDELRVVHQGEVRLSASKANLEIAQQELAVAVRVLETDRQKAAAALQAAQVRAADARAKADRMKQLLEKHLTSQEEYDTAETAASTSGTDLISATVKIEELKTQEIALELKRQAVALAKAQVEADEISLSIAQDRHRDTKVEAPIDGIVAVRNVQIGQIISSGISNVGGGTTVLTLSDLSRIFILASVDESQIGKVRLDQEADITADAFPGRTFQGKVVRIATRGVNLSNVVTFEVKIEVIGEARTLLRPEMTANVVIIVSRKDSALLVPSEAVFLRKGKPFVQVARDDGTREESPVETDLTDGTKTEITRGLAEGQTVVVQPGGAESRWSNGQRPQGGAPRNPMFPGAGKRGGK